MANSVAPDQLVSSEAICKGRVYLGSAGQGLNEAFLLYLMVFKAQK